MIISTKLALHLGAVYLSLLHSVVLASSHEGFACFMNFPGIKDVAGSEDGIAASVCSAWSSSTCCTASTVAR